MDKVAEQLPVKISEQRQPSQRVAVDGARVLATAVEALRWGGPHPAIDPDSALASFALWKGSPTAATARREKVAKRATALEAARA